RFTPESQQPANANCWQLVSVHHCADCALAHCKVLGGLFGRHEPGLHWLYLPIRKGINQSLSFSDGRDCVHSLSFLSRTLATSFSNGASEPVDPVEKGSVLTNHSQASKRQTCSQSSRGADSSS